MLPRRSKGVEADDLELPRSGAFGDLAICIVPDSIDLTEREEGSCNLRRKGGPSEHLEPIYAFASSAGEAT